MKVYKRVFSKPLGYLDSITNGTIASIIYGPTTSNREQNPQAGVRFPLPSINVLGRSSLRP